MQINSNSLHFYTKACQIPYKKSVFNTVSSFKHYSSPKYEAISIKGSLVIEVSQNNLNIVCAGQDYPLVNRGIVIQSEQTCARFKA